MTSTATATGRRRGPSAGCSARPPCELRGTSAFLRDGDRALHTHPTYARGTEQVGGTHYYLDMTALGRQEDWEEPKGRSTGAPRADQVGAGRT